MRDSAARTAKLGLPALAIVTLLRRPCRLAPGRHIAARCPRPRPVGATNAHGCRRLSRWLRRWTRRARPSAPSLPWMRFHLYAGCSQSERPPPRRRCELATASRHRASVRGVFLLALCFQIPLAAVFTTACLGQNVGAFKGFKVAQPYPAPYEKQTKSQLEAGRAVPVRGGYLLSEGVLLRTYSETNTLQLTARANECFYSSTNRAVNSAGPLRLETADGKFSIEGVGFYWQQTNSSFFISNKVHTVIQAELFQPAGTNQSSAAGAADTGSLTILSERFSYNGTNGLGKWRENVRVTGTNLVLSSALLTARIPMAQKPLEQHRVLSLLAETNVTVKYNELFGTGARLTYAPETGLIRLLDQATWRTPEGRQGRGDELVIDRSNQVFQVNGHAWMKLPGQGIGQSGFLSFSNTPVQNTSQTNQRSIEIACQRYEIRTNLATFHDRVRLNELWNGAPRGRMECRERMMVRFAGSNELQSILADKHVVIEEGDFAGAAPANSLKRFEGEHAEYTQTNTTLVLTGHPSWQAGLRRGRGEVLRLNTQQSELLVSGNASLHLPANEMGSQLTPTNHAGAVARRPSAASTNEFADIFCDHYLLNATNSIFRGGVYATHPEMNCTCEEMTIQVPSDGLTNIISNGHVVFDLLTQQGKVHGTGDNALYSFGLLNSRTNALQPIDQLKLFGTPAFLSTTNRTLEDRIIVWDRLRNKVVMAGGDYKMRGTGPAVNTNIMVLPNKKRTK